MISRRLIRIKVLQILYSSQNIEDKNLLSSEKELFKSIDKSFELYHLLFLLIIDVMRYAEDRIEVARSKKLPTKEDLNPNTRFINNPVILQLRENKMLERYLRETKISWAGHSDLVRHLFNDLKETEFYNKYMAAPENNYKNDRSAVVQLLTKVIICNEMFQQTLEDMSIFWNDDLEHVTNMVVKTFDGFKESDKSDKPLMDLFKNEDDKDFAKNLFRKTLVSKDYFNQLVEKHTANWELDRIAFMDILVMHMAMAEMIEFPSIPIKVTLNEYIDIAKDYSTDKSGIFVNGVLDKALQSIKEDGKISKTGRGLLEN